MPVVSQLPGQRTYLISLVLLNTSLIWEAGRLALLYYYYWPPCLQTALSQICSD